MRTSVEARATFRLGEFAPDEFEKVVEMAIAFCELHAGVFRGFLPILKFAKAWGDRWARATGMQIEANLLSLESAYFG